MSEIRLIAGLGNPGGEYEYTRHNLGFLVLQRLAKELKLKFRSSSLTKGLLAEGVVAGKELCLLMPLTFMNHSGIAVKGVAKNRGLTPNHILVICDDFNLDFGRLRIRRKGSDGGHNGLSSVIYHMETEAFARLRMGIGQPPKGKETVDYVLEKFDKQEEDCLDGFINEAVSCCLVWVQEGVNVAMDRYNVKK